jgi:hypothetical protein
MKKYFFFAIILFMACNTSRNVDCRDGTIFTLKDFSGLDGCTWILENSNGDRLEAVNLNDYLDDFKAGDQYVINYQEAPDMASICMAGTLVKITCLKRK